MIFSGTQIFEYTHTQGKSRLEYKGVIFAYLLTQYEQLTTLERGHTDIIAIACSTPHR